MSGFSFGGGQARNPRRTYEKLYTSSDALQLTSNPTANQIGNYQSLNTPSSNLCGVFLTFGSTSTNSNRYQFYLRGNGSAILIPGYHFQLVTSAYVKVHIPIKIPSGTTLECAVRSSASSATCRVYVEGIVANGLDSPGFDAMEDAASIVTGSTRPSSINIPNTNSWTQLIASSAHAYGAMLLSVGDNGTAPASGYRDELALGVWNGSNYDEIFTDYVSVLTSTPYVYGGNISLIEAAIPSGSNIGVKLKTGTSNSDNLRVGAWGFY